jgi:hypothetical protein
MVPPARNTAMAASYELRCGELTHYVTMCPPLPVEWGSGWWVRIEDVWIRIRERGFGEQITPEIEREICEKVQALYRKPGE